METQPIIISMVLIIAAAYNWWNMSRIFKIFEEKHPKEYAKLGKPSLMKNNWNIVPQLLFGKMMLPDNQILKQKILVYRILTPFALLLFIYLLAIGGFFQMISR